MTKLVSIAWVTLREALRQKLAVNLLVFAVALVASSIVISTLTFGEQYRIIADIGLSAMEVFGTLIAVFLGASLIARDVERRTVYPIVAKPVSRAQYVAGRYLGLLTTTTLNLLVMAVFFSGVLAFYQGNLEFVKKTPLIANLVSMALQFGMIGAIAVFFSCFSTATLSAIFTLSLTAAGHLSADLVRYWGKEGEGARVVGKLFYLIVPNLEALNFKEAMVYKEPLIPGLAATGFAYGLLYISAVVALSAAVFSRRDLR